MLPASLLNEAIELEEFDISRNELYTIHANTFHNLRQLRSLDLSENQIGKALLSSSVILLASVNRCMALIFSSLYIYFYILSNFSANISDVAFISLERLDVLNMRDNRLSEISRNLLSNFTSLLNLDLSLNRIRSIDRKAFENLLALDELHLGQNAIASIPNGLFKRQQRLRRLILFSNSLTAIGNETFVGLVGVKTLLLNNNVLKDMEAGVFEPMDSLEKL